METRMKEQLRRETEQRTGYAAQQIMVNMMETGAVPMKVTELKSLATLSRECAEVLHKPAVETAE